MNFLHLQPLTLDLIPAAVALDQLCLGGMWTAAGYEREVDSPNATLLILQQIISGQNPSNDSPAPPPLCSATPPLLALGCIWTILEEAHLTLLAVHPDHRGQGLGQALLVELMAAAWQQGMEWVTLEVRASNLEATALYQKFDFCEVGRRKRYYQNPEEDALILWRSGLKREDFPDTLQHWRKRVGDRLNQSGWQLQKSTSPKNYPFV